MERQAHRPRSVRLTSARRLLVIALLTLVSSPAGARLGWAQDDAAALFADLTTEDPEVQTATIDALIALGPAAVSVLESALADPTTHPRQRAGAAFVLGRIGAESSRVVLAALWTEGLDGLGSGLAMQIAIALAEYDELEPLRALVGAGNPILAAKSAVQLGLRRDAESVGALELAWERDDYVRMRPFFAIGLALLGDNRGEEVLRAGLQTPELRNHCAVALAGLGDPGPLRFDLTFAFSDADPLVRLRALEALIEVAPSNLDDLLERAREDTDPRVRALALEATRRGRRPRR